MPKTPANSGRGSKGIETKETRVERSKGDENGGKHRRRRDKEERVVERTRKLLTKIGDRG